MHLVGAQGLVVVDAPPNPLNRLVGVRVGVTDPDEHGVTFAVHDGQGTTIVLVLHRVLNGVVLHHRIRVDEDGGGVYAPRQRSAPPPPMRRAAPPPSIAISSSSSREKLGSAPTEAAALYETYVASTSDAIWARRVAESCMGTWALHTS